MTSSSIFCLLPKPCFLFCIQKKKAAMQLVWNIIATQQDLLDIHLQLEKCGVIKINFNCGREPGLSRSHLKSPALLQGGAGDTW